MRHLSSFALLLVVATLPIGCAVYSNSSYSAWEGPAVLTGTGGTKKTVDGIDIWQVGTPPCTFQVLGLVSQRNYSDGSALSVLANVNAENELVKQAKLHGGDAIVWLSANSQVTGYSSTYRGTYQGTDYGNGSYAGTSNGSLSTRANTLQQNGVAVIKYLPQPVTAPAPPPVTESYMPTTTPANPTP